MPNFIDEYLIKLGSAVDESGMRRFENAVRSASSLVEDSTASMAASILKVQTEIVAGFVAIGGAAVGLADKVAMADQDYRLFALHMYMSKDAARALKVAMDELHEPLENLMWDPELRERTKQLIADQRAMAPEGGFDANMRKIRDIRFEFTRMQVELQYLTMHVVNDFLKALGLGPDTLLKNLRTFNYWVTHNLPAISNEIVQYLLPVWHDVEDVVSNAARAIGAVAGAFENLVALLTGDFSIIGAANNIGKLGKSADDASHFFANIADTISQVIELVAHLANALVDLSAGKFKAAGGEAKLALNQANLRLVTTLAGGVAGSFLGPKGTLIGAGVGAQVGTKLDYATGLSSDVHGLIDYYGKQMGWSPQYTALAHSIAKEESGERQYDASGNVVRSKAGALGAMQLMPVTAKSLGVDATNPGSNVIGGLTLLRQLLAHYHGNVANAVAAYNFNPAGVDRVLAGKGTLPAETRKYVADVMARMGKTGDVQIGSIVIHVNKNNAVNGDVANAVVAKLREAQGKETQRNMLEFQSLSASY